ncbi:hypothetical protein BDB00DRAFT_570563 [Zychaea mexicana]|uniref:uncharacterized protein n=1 Tax=Zychaea mexicana TaxID=64656 RepID=UPI0022FF1DA4|nr:uncharacterized protein BDB00DRAFT_570563 [Zychaea mexicana]KAI9490111.1 hypothetical protein BDB00DRAFT_570563 [Zychaea mexicana]
MYTFTFRLNNSENNIHRCQYCDKVMQPIRTFTDIFLKSIDCNQDVPAESISESRETEDSDLGDEGDNFDDTSVIDQEDFFYLEVDDSLEADEGEVSDFNQQGAYHR